MADLRFRRAALTVVGAFIGVLCMVPQVHAQAAVRGVVLDADGEPIPEATVTIVSPERSYEVQTNDNGEFIQIGITPGAYTLTAIKDNLQASMPIQASTNSSEPFSVTLLPPTANPAAGAGEKVLALNQQAIAASDAGDHDGAIAAYNDILVIFPDCPECHDGIAQERLAMKDYEGAEAAYNAAIELSPDYAPAYAGLAIVYSAQNRLDEAATANAKAVELQTAAGGTGGDPDTLYNQGVIAWNSGKAEEAQGHFRSALEADPGYAPAHYQLGMTYINGNMLPQARTEFEQYLELAPDGEFAAQAKAMLGALPE